MTHRAGIGVAVLAAAGALLSPAAARAVDGPATGCELHVSPAGYPNRTFKGNAFVKVQAPPPGGAVFTTSNVARALDDAALQRLVADAGPVTVVRHEMVDLDQKKLDGRAPLYPSSAGCYADLVVDNTYAILTDTVDRARAGLVGQLIVGGSRMISSFWLQVYRDRAAKPAVYHKKVDSSLRSTTAEVTSGSDAARADLVQASAANLDQFAAFVASKTAK